MLVGVDDKQELVKFVSYTGSYPNLCSGKLTLEIEGETVSFGYGDGLLPPFWTSGGGLDHHWEAYCGEWEIDVSRLPENYRKYASSIDRVFNENVEYGCCGGCT